MASSSKGYCDHYNNMEEKVEGSPTFIWESKLKDVKQALKRWSKYNYEEPYAGKKKLQDQLAVIQQ